tara:strand:- start:98 stop:637 length:540 start_codon:yes stop_codon:yes gene_type:complete
MSRIGQNPISIPDGVKIKLTDSFVSISSQKGVLEFSFNKNIKVSKKEETLIVSRSLDTKEQRALHGTTRQILNNMVIGVSEGFHKELEIIGVGYQAIVQGSRLQLQLGFSHDIYFDMPDGITITANRTEIKVEGIDKQLVGAVAAKIRSFRPPEPYKGKGVRYKGERVRTKQGKTVGAK